MLEMISDGKTAKALPMAEGMQDAIAMERELRMLRERLVDTGARNRMIHINRKAARANCINVVRGDSGHIFRILRVDERKMQFKATGDEEEVDEGLGLAFAYEDMMLAPADDGVSIGRLADSYLETNLDPEALARRVLNMARHARAAEEEQGVNVLFLAMGFLRWKASPSSEIVRESPLILLPVELTRASRGSNFKVTCRGDDITSNLPLAKRLNAEFAIELPEIDDSKEWDPSGYFARVHKAISGHPDWSVDDNGIQLGFFSSSKHLMHRDLNPARWAEGAFAENPILGGLIGSRGFGDSGPRMFGDDEKINIDAVLSPKDIVQVISADTSQTKVIEEVRAGASLVVQGPPGTGKSQTITNIIAAAVHDGKRVLFVAEKMAALSVVHNRLVKTGLGHICLELHSNKANKKSVLAEIESTLNLGAEVPDAEDGPESRLLEVRDRLNEICDMLHTPIHGSTETPYDALSEIIGFTGREESPSFFPHDGFENIGKEERERVDGIMRKYAEATARAGNANDHPFRHVGNLDLQPTDMGRLDQRIDAATKAIASLDGHGRNLAEMMGRPAPECIAGAILLAEIARKLAGVPDGIAEYAGALIHDAGTARLTEALKAGVRWVDAKTEADGHFWNSTWRAEASTETVEAATDTISAIDALGERVRGLADEMGRSAPETIAGAVLLAKAAGKLSNAPEGVAECAEALIQDAGSRRLADALGAGARWAAEKAEADEHFTNSAWSVDGDRLCKELTQGRDSWWSRTFGGFKKAARELSVILVNPIPDDRNAVCDLAKRLAAAQGVQREFTNDEEWLQGVLGPHWRALKTPFMNLGRMSTWLGDIKECGEFEDGEIVRLLRAVKNPGRDSEALVAESAKCRTAAQGVMGRINVEPQAAFGCRVDDVPLESMRRAFESMRRAFGARCEFAADEEWLLGVLGSQWRDIQTPFADIIAASAWLGEIKECGEFAADEIVRLLASMKDPERESADLVEEAEKCRAAAMEVIEQVGLDTRGAFGCEVDDTPLEALSGAFGGMRGAQGQYADWKALAGAREDFAASAAAPLMAALDSGVSTVEEVSSEFKFACAEARWNAALKVRPEIRALENVDRREVVREFRSLESLHIKATKAKILKDHEGQMPQGASGEMGILLGEFGRKRGHRPIRRLIADAGRMIQRVKPVMLMSPISVAQFLRPGAVEFDLLVIDEASQVRPEDAIGAIARAKQVVVVGDQKQLPPTSFFARLADDAEDDEDDEDKAPVAAAAVEMESILNLCAFRGMRDAMLRWHYRSRDPSLIRVSNAEFYSDGLILPPSPLEKDDDYGMKFTRVDGVYTGGKDSGARQGTNRIEAEAIADRLAEHARKWANLSVGVVAFSRHQTDMLTEVLELRRREDPALDALLREGKYEDVFVKNIENVQGDERDVILISVGYGPSEAGGRLRSLNFGPVSKEGGERRLNVLFTRSRVRCEIFASFDPGDINVDKATQAGRRVLKRFLKFAKEGMIDESGPTGLDFDSDFERDVAGVIGGLGYDLDPQVGDAGFRIDIGVKNPDRLGQYIIAVECDGATYHSALSARERDRHRQEVLEGMGWKFHRVWSTDWYYHREREIGKLKDALTCAREQSKDGIRVNGANAGEPKSSTSPSAESPTSP